MGVGTQLAPLIGSAKKSGVKLNTLFSSDCDSCDCACGACVELAAAAAAAALSVLLATPGCASGAIGDGITVPTCSTTVVLVTLPSTSTGPEACSKLAGTTTLSKTGGGAMVIVGIATGAATV